MCSQYFVLVTIYAAAFCFCCHGTCCRQLHSLRWFQVSWNCGKPHRGIHYSDANRERIPGLIETLSFNTAEQCMWLLFLLTKTKGGEKKESENTDSGVGKLCSSQPGPRKTSNTWVVLVTLVALICFLKLFSLILTFTKCNTYFTNCFVTLKTPKNMCTSYPHTLFPYFPGVTSGSKVARSENSFDWLTIVGPATLANKIYFYKTLLLGRLGREEVIG